MPLDTTQEEELNGLLTQMQSDGRTEDEMRQVANNYVSQYSADDGEKPEVEETPVVEDAPVVDQPKDNISATDFVNQVRGPLFLEGYEAQPNKEEQPLLTVGAESIPLPLETLQNDVTNLQAAYDEGDRHTKNKLGYDLRQKKKQLEKLQKEPQPEVKEEEKAPVRQELQESIDVLKSQGYDDDYIQEVSDVWQMQDAGILPSEKVVKPEDLPIFNPPADWSKPFNKKKVTYGVLSPVLNMEEGPDGEVLITGEESPIMTQKAGGPEGLVRWSEYANMTPAEREDWNRKYQSGEIELSLGESMKRSSEGAVNRLMTIDDRVNQGLAMLVGKAGFTKGSYQYAKKTGKDLKKLEEISGGTLGFTDIDTENKTGLENVKTGIGAFYNATTSVAASAIQNKIPGLLAVDMISTSVYDYNKIKADEVGVDLATLSATGQTDLVEPTVIGAVSHQLEKIGLKGMEKYIKNVPTEYKRKILDFVYNGQVEGVTEYLQGTLEAYNNSKAKYIGQGLNATDATAKAMEDAGEFMTSKEALESYLQGVAGSSGTTIIGAAANRRGNKEAVEENLSKSSTIDGALSNKGLTQDEKTELQNTKNTLEQERVELKQEPYVELANLDAESITHISNLNKDVVAFNQQIFNTQKSENLTDEQKETVITQLENNISKIQFEADNLISQANETKEKEYDTRIEDAKNKAVKAAKEKAPDDSVIDIKSIGEEAENVEKAKIQKELDTQQKDPVKHINNKFPNELASAPSGVQTPQQTSVKAYQKASNNVSGLKSEIRRSKKEGVYTGKVKDKSGRLLKPRESGYVSVAEGAEFRKQDAIKLSEAKKSLKTLNEQQLEPAAQKKFKVEAPQDLHTKIVNSTGKGVGKTSFDIIDNLVASGGKLTNEQRTKIKPISDKIKGLTTELGDLWKQKKRLQTKDVTVPKQGQLGNQGVDFKGEVQTYDQIYGKPSREERGYISIDPQIHEENVKKGLKPGDKGWKSAKVDTRKLNDRIKAIQGSENQIIGIDKTETTIKKRSGEIWDEINKIYDVREDFSPADKAKSRETDRSKKLPFTRESETGKKIRDKTSKIQPKDKDTNKARTPERTIKKEFETFKKKFPFEKMSYDQWKKRYNVLTEADEDEVLEFKGWWNQNSDKIVKDYEAEFGEIEQLSPKILTHIVGRDLAAEVKRGELDLIERVGETPTYEVPLDVLEEKYGKKVADVARAYRMGKDGVKWVNQNGERTDFAALTEEEKAISILKNVYLPKKVRKSNKEFYDDINEGKEFIEGKEDDEDTRTPLQKIKVLSPHEALQNKVDRFQGKIDYLKTLPISTTTQEVDKQSAEYIWTTEDKITEYQKMIDGYQLLLDTVPKDSPILYRGYNQKDASGAGYVHGSGLQFEKPQGWDETVEKRDNAETEAEYNKYEQVLREISPIQEWIGRSIAAGSRNQWKAIEDAGGYSKWFKTKVDESLESLAKFNPSKEDNSKYDPVLALKQYGDKRSLLVKNLLKEDEIPSDYTVDNDPDDFSNANKQRVAQGLDKLQSNKEIKSQLDRDIADGDITQNYQKSFVYNTPKASHFTRQFGIQANRPDSVGATLKFGHTAGNNVVSFLPNDANYDDVDGNKIGNIETADSNIVRQVGEGDLQVDKNGNIFKSAKVYAPRLEVSGKDITPASELLVGVTAVNLATDNLQANVYEAMLLDRIAERNLELEETTFDVLAAESTRERAQEETEAKKERTKLRKIIQNKASKPTTRQKALQKMHNLEAEFVGIVPKGRQTAQDFATNLYDELQYTLKPPTTSAVNGKEASYESLKQQIEIRYNNGDPITISAKEAESFNKSEFNKFQLSRGAKQVELTLEEAIENLDSYFGKSKNENAFDSGWASEQQASLMIAKRAKGFKIGGWNEQVEGNIAASLGNLKQAESLWATAEQKSGGSGLSGDKIIDKEGNYVRAKGSYAWSKTDQTYFDKAMKSIPSASRPSIRRSFKSLTGKSMDVAQRDGTFVSLLKKNKKEIIKRAKAEGVELASAGENNSWYSGVNKNELVKDILKSRPGAAETINQYDIPTLISLLDIIDPQLLKKYPTAPVKEKIQAADAIEDWFDVRTGDGLSKINAILKQSRKFLSSEEIELVSSLTGVDQAIKAGKVTEGLRGSLGGYNPSNRVIAQQQAEGRVIETLLHENTHAWFEKLKRVDKPLYNKLFNIISKDAGFKKWVKQLKDNPTEFYAKYVRSGDLETLIDEYFAFQTGSKGAKVVKEFDNSTLSKIKSWVGDLMKFLGNKLKFNKNFKTIDDFSNAALRDVLLGESNIKNEMAKQPKVESNKDYLDDAGGEFSSAVDAQFDNQFSRLKNDLQTMNPNNLESRDARNIARELLTLTDEDLNTIKEDDFDTLLSVIKSINAGELTKESFNFINELKGKTRGVILGQQLKKQAIKPGAWSKIKSVVRGGKVSALAEKLRGQPTFFFEEALGISGKKFFNSTFGKLANADSRLTKDKGDVSTQLGDIDTLLNNHFKGDINKRAKSNYKQMAYLVQLKYENNKGEISATDQLDIQIKAIKEGKSDFYEDSDLELFEEINESIKDKSSDQMKDLFDPVEVKALEAMQKIAKEVEDKVIAVANITGSNKIIKNNIFSGSINPEYGKSKNQFELFVDSNGESLYAQANDENGQINMDPINALYRTANGALMDFHMTPVIKEVNSLVDSMIDEVRVGGDTTGKLAAKAIKEVINENMRNVFDANLHVSGGLENFASEVKKLGYLKALASPIRASIEYSSNAIYQAIRQGLNMRTFSSTNEFKEFGRDIMYNVGSEHTNKNFAAEDSLTGRLVETNVAEKSTISTPKKAASGTQGEVSKAMSIIRHSLPGRGVAAAYNWSTNLATKLVSRPDQIISRAAWEKMFLKTFKEITNVKPDLQAIARNDEAYLTEFADAISTARSRADQDVTESTASTSPFNAALKHQINPNDSVKRKIYVNANSFFTKHQSFEASNAKTAVQALMGKGEMSRKDGAKLLAAIQARNITYVMGLMIGSALSWKAMTAVAELAGYAVPGDDADEEDILSGESWLFAFLSAQASLITGKSGQIPRIAIALGLNKLNEEYGGALRDGKKYDDYDHGLMRGLITKKDIKRNDEPWDYIPNLSGAYGSQMKAVADLLRAVRGLGSKKFKTREAHKSDIQRTLIMEGIVQPFFTPIYRDTNREWKKIDYLQGQKRKGGGGSSKRTRKKRKVRKRRVRKN